MIERRRIGDQPLISQFHQRIIFEAILFPDAAPPVGKATRRFDRADFSTVEMLQAGRDFLPLTMNPADLFQELQSQP